MRYVVVLIALCFILFLFVYTGILLYRWLKAFSSVKAAAFGIPYGIVTAAILALFFLSRIPNIPVPRFLLQFGHYGLGFLVYTTLFANVIALLLWLGRLLRLIPSPLPTAVSIAAFSLCALLVVGLGIYGTVNARTIRTVSYEVTVESTQDKGESLKIALVSDLHLGYIVDETRLTEIVEAINKTEPDLVCIAGDVFDGDMTALSNTDALKTLFRSIDARYGVYACLGNHDAGASYNEMLAFLSDAGVRVLSDEYMVIDNRLLLVGRRDSSSIGAHGVDRADSVLLPEGNLLPVIVLDHQPGNISQYGDEVDLILCGHTHKGQMFPANLITKATNAVDYGYYRASEKAPQVIVTSGAGTWGPPLRIGSNCEIVEITVQLP